MSFNCLPQITIGATDVTFLWVFEVIWLKYKKTTIIIMRVQFTFAMPYTPTIDDS